MSILSVGRRTVIGAVFVAATLVPSAAERDAFAQFQTTPTLFSGQAVAVKGTVLGLPIALVDTGTVAVEGGTLQAHLFCYPNGPDCTLGLPDVTGNALAVSVLNATVVAQGHRSHARASVADLSLTLPGFTIAASFLQAEATARCSAGQASIDAQSDVVELEINGERIVVTGEVDQTITFPGGLVIVINEQVASVNGGTGDMTVTALHIKLPGPVPGTDTDLVVAQAHADIQCGQRFCPAEKDFVTGGGWLADPRRTFAVAGGIKNGAYWGHLMYIDHSTRMRVKGTGVTGYTVTGQTSRRIEGTCLIDGVAGTYQVDVDDQGEPGKSDVFSLTLNGAPVEHGTLAGGNVQLHTCK